jgi:methylated-DNA-[protein]-cysteine S-methyltransferase
MRVITPFLADNSLLLEITVQDDCIKNIDYILSSRVVKQGEKTSFRAKQIQAEFLNYFKDPAHLFTLQYQLDSATAFQQRVYKALIEIPSGEVRTYSELAKQLNSSPRAVGNACRSNPIPVIIPCHRVVSITGIGGYAGDTLENQKGSINYVGIKLCLLKHEKGLLEHEKGLLKHENGLLKYEKGLLEHGQAKLESTAAGKRRTTH